MASMSPKSPRPCSILSLLPSQALRCLCCALQAAVADESLGGALDVALRETMARPVVALGAPIAQLALIPSSPQDAPTTESAVLAMTSETQGLTLTMEATVSAGDTSAPTEHALLNGQDSAGSPAQPNAPPPPSDGAQLALEQTKLAPITPTVMHFAEDLFEGLGDLPDSELLSPHATGPPSTFASGVPVSNGGLQDAGPSPRSPAPCPNAAHVATVSPSGNPTAASAGNELTATSPLSNGAASPLENSLGGAHPLGQAHRPPDGDRLEVGVDGATALEAGQENGTLQDGGGVGSLTPDAPKEWSGTVTEEVQRILGWHMANLEYGCSAPLHRLSVAHWNQVRAVNCVRLAHDSSWRSSACWWCRLALSRPCYV